MIDSNFIVKKVKSKGFKLGDVASMIGIQYQTLNKNLKAGSYDTAKRISEVTGIYFFELMPPPEGFMHLYDDKTGKWLGIIPKPQTYHATPQELASIDEGLAQIKAGNFYTEEEVEEEMEKILWEK